MLVAADHGSVKEAAWTEDVSHGRLVTARVILDLRLCAGRIAGFVNEPWGRTIESRFFFEGRVKTLRHSWPEVLVGLRGVRFGVAFSQKACQIPSMVRGSSRTCLINGLGKKRRVSSGAKARIFLALNVGAEVPSP